VLAATAVVAPSLAIERISVHMGRVHGGGWSSGAVDLELGFLADNRLSLRLRSDGLSLPEPFGALGTLSVECPRAVATAAGVECRRGELGVERAGGRALRVPLSMGLAQSDGRWRLRLTAEGLAPGPLWALAADQGLLPALELGGGELSLSLLLVRNPGGPAAHLAAALSGLNFSDAPGLHVGEGLNARLEWHVAARGRSWRSRAELQVDAGQLYLDPVFLDAGVAPISVSAAGDFHPSSGSLRLSRLRFHHDSVATVDGSLRLAGGGALEALDLRLSRAPLGPVYRTYLQPFAVGTLFDALQVEGDVEARLQWHGSAAQRRLQLDFHDAGVADDAGRFSIFGIDGSLDWDQSGDADASTLAWEGGQLYRIDFGSGSLDGRFAGRRFDLGARLSVPLLGGGVDVDALEVTAIGTPDLQWKFRGAVQPMSLEALTGALGWPSFGGTLAGDIPLVSYAAGTITVDGSLDVEVFDGAVGIKRLSIADPFGVIPVLRADVDVHDLSLAALTGTFSFGNIQGKLEGRVHGLVLKDWKPTAFDARFATPDDDDSRHRISQRAVENLASLGGAGAVLSSTFLRIFEEFSYRRLGISCRLDNGVCEMGGVAPAERGYFLVQGGGLPPRIDVLGFNRRVDWDVLLGRLQRVTSEGPVIR
jgi:hypothetical protein